jgi:hypothetical protein
LKTLWTFGDSFTQPFDETPFGWMIDYVKWKGYVPKVYGQIISDELGLCYENKARAGISNYDIFESICKSVNLIKDDDVIIIGWSNLLRFRLVNHPSSHLWEAFQPNYMGLKLPEGISIDTINEIIINRSNTELYKEEVNNWIKLLKHTFKNNTILFWSWSDRDWGMPTSQYESMLPNSKYENIRDETNGEVNDNHWSETGHIQFANYILPKLKTEKCTNLLENYGKLI